MKHHEAKNCPRCNLPFECKPGNITQCQCFSFTFSEAEKEYIRTTYTDCLCSNCLSTIKHEIRDNTVKKKMTEILSVFKKQH